MRAVIWLTAAFAIFYGGYWAVGSRAVMEGTEVALADLRAAGRAEYGEVTLEGFPSRFDLAIENLQLTSADGAVHWSAPRVQVYALSYKPHHIIAALPPDQTLRVGREEIAIRSGDLRASAVFGIDPDLPLKRAQSVGTELALTSDHGWGATARELRLAIREGITATEQDVGAEVFDLSLSGQPSDLLTQAGLPTGGGHVRLDAILTLDHPLNRHLPAEPLSVTAADIRSAELTWGTVQISASGRIEIAGSGQPEGRLELTIRDWRGALPLATALGLIKPEIAPTVEKALDGFAQLDGNSELTLPLVIKEGWINLGPVPLGPAPLFYLDN
ncbi:DUF2125 domain-containing protein [Defluviimonas sp. WL0050]|uniref:DUF2125 domain-containing protein n=1 Tax=Albidovulum litorale TaxID=2984134 RepID=A0ABT2ZSX1_9RHOB|nr:DUF2125 domain-containing protein [Defluviimonas sp. WL0050]MCV2874258.1 DUF2125 domain-containing protein [Defluviimonas sp. WL0050]